MPSDKVQDALEQWNTRVDPPDIRRVRGHTKQVEWERDQAVLKLERAQLIIDLNIGGEMKQEVAEAIAILKAQGVDVAVDPRGLTLTFTLRSYQTGTDTSSYQPEF